VELDLGQPDLAVAVHQLVAGAYAESHPGDVAPPFDVFALELANPEPRTETRWFGAEYGGRLAAAASLVIDGGDPTPDLARVEVHVAPDARGLGLTRAVVAPVVEAAMERGRTRLIGDAVEGSVGASWCRHVGAEVGMVERHSRLDVAGLDLDLMTKWATPAAGYDLVRWDGPCPDGLLDVYAVLKDAQNTAPTEGIEVAFAHYLPAEVAAIERSRVARGETWCTFAIRHEATGALVGYTVVFGCPWDPGLQWQGWTVVDPDHRGRGLARWLKGAMALRLSAGGRDQPLRTVETDNAASNEAMLTINKEMGFAPWLSVEIYQIATLTLAAWARSR
jgi:GNAT superfamily N-acetyltransferase